MKAIHYLVVHCSDSPNERESVDAAQIHRWHVQKGWSGVGYHAVIKRNGVIELCRPLFWEGAHVLGYNDQSLGVCLVGTDAFTDMQMQSLQRVLKEWQRRFPAAVVVGHCDLDKNKTCPNFDVGAWWSEVAS